MIPRAYEMADRTVGWLLKLTDKDTLEEDGPVPEELMNLLRALEYAD